MAHRSIFTLFELAEQQAAAEPVYSAAYNPLIGAWEPELEPEAEYSRPVWHTDPVDEFAEDLITYARAEAEAGRAVYGQITAALVIRLAVAVVMAAALLSFFG